MEIRGWPRILALVVASAFGGALAFAVCVVAFFSYFSVGGRTAEIHERQAATTVHDAPPIRTAKRFLGTMGAYGSEFDMSGGMDKVLERGPGEITGSITANGSPVAHVKISLALNGSVMSQWGESGSDGKYHIAVPFGTYRIDGYRLDPSNLSDLMPGKTDNPKSVLARLDTAPITVAAGKTASGLNLDYIDPIELTGPSGDVSIGKPIVVSWNAYPGAVTYRIQLRESKKPGPLEGRHEVFRWADRPEVLGTSVDLTKSHAELHVGSYYEVEVEALDQSMSVIATTGNRFTITDFKVVE